VIFLFAGGFCSVKAHQNSTAYLFLDQTQRDLQGRWEIPIADWSSKSGLDDNIDGEVTWAEIKQKSPRFASTRCRVVSFAQANDESANHISRRAHQQATSRCDARAALGSSPAPPRHATVEYNFGFDYDGGHQCILSFPDRTAVLTKDRRTFELIEARHPNRLFTSFVRVGVSTFSKESITSAFYWR
jgi:hypothetical protein